MEMTQKRIMAVNDISCFGKCSLTTALPILSAAGMEACPLPTALLSTHTGGFDGFTFKRLDDQILPITNHWKRLGLEFDAIYSGYLGSYEQIDYVRQIIKDFAREKTTVLIDPVMGDNGRLYTGFDTEFSKGMFELCKCADIIVPNITEASYMLDMPCKQIYCKEDIADIFEKFYINGIKKAVITGIPVSEEKISCGILDESNVSFIENTRIEGMYHGTGDVFASALISGYMKGKTLFDAAGLAAWYVYEAILITKERYGMNHYGVDFEDILGEFIQRIKE